MSFYSRGSLSFVEAYNLPIPIRQLFLNEMNSFITEENKAAQKAAKKART